MSKVGAPNTEVTVKPSVNGGLLDILSRRNYSHEAAPLKEAISNSWDADATEVHIEITGDHVEIRDNGHGLRSTVEMQKFLAVGSPHKQEQKKSEFLGRQLIGQMGIGSLAPFALAKRFTVTTQGRGSDYSAEVSVSLDEYKRFLTEHDNNEGFRVKVGGNPDPERKHGMTIRYEDLTEKLDPKVAKEWLLDHFNFNREKFAVYINGVRVVHRSQQGRTVPVLKPTPFGDIEGEVTLVPPGARVQGKAGFSVQVGGNPVGERQMFGAEAWGAKGRFVGHIEVPFLNGAINPGRSGFAAGKKTTAYEQAMREYVEETLKPLMETQADDRERKVASEALKDVMDSLSSVLETFPELAPDKGGLLGPPGRRSKPIVTIDPNARPRTERPNPPLPEVPGAEKGKGHRSGHGGVKPGIAGELKIGPYSIATDMGYFGGQRGESWREGGVVLIDKDHPLYKVHKDDPMLHRMHLARILSLEAALLAEIPDTRITVQRGSEIMTKMVEVMQKQRQSGK